MATPEFHFLFLSVEGSIIYIILFYFDESRLSGYFNGRMGQKMYVITSLQRLALK